MLELRALGGLTLQGADPPLQPKRLALLTYLALARPRGFHRRDTLVALFWPDLDEAHARPALRQALTALRSLNDSLIHTRGDEEVAVASTALACDALAFEAALERGERERALELYAGSFLQGFFLDDCPEFEHWVDGERVRLQSLAAGAAWGLADGDLETNPAGAVRWARMAAEFQRDDEAAVRRLIQILDRAGDRAGALREYERFAERLREEYQAEPAPETLALVESVRVRHPSGVGGAIGPPTAGPLQGPITAPEYRPLHPVRHPVTPGSPTVRTWARAAALLVTGGLVILSAMLVLRVRSGPHAAAHPLSSLAVLPFTNQTGDSAQGYFVDGMHRGVIGELARASVLMVKSGRSVTRYRASRKPVSQIGDELGVGALVEAEVTRVGDSVGLEVHLVQARSERELWSQRFQVPAAHVYPMYREIAEAVVQQLLPGVTAPRLAVRAPRSVDPDAYRAFLRGEQSGTTDLLFALNVDTRKAIAAFERAVKLDPDFADAHARLAIAYATLAFNDGTADRKRLAALGLRHADWALALDSTVALGYVALARHAQVVSRDMRRGLPYLQRAQELEPGSDEVLVELLFVYLTECDYRRGAELGTRAFQLNPFNGWATLLTGIGYWGTLKALLMASFDDPAHFDAARAKAAHDSAAWYLSRTIELGPDDAQNYMYAAYWYMSMERDTKAARGLLQRSERTIGTERTTAAFFRSAPEASRILAGDGWYRALVERANLGSPNFDSTDYYAHKAMLYDGMGNASKARAYWDSVRTVAHGENVRGMFNMRPWDLAMAYARLGERQSALDLSSQLRSAEVNRCWSDYYLALVEAAAGLEDAAVARLEDVALRQPIAFVTPKFLSLDPGLRALRANPRFRKLLTAY